jgi:gliding motility-associated-like protein
LLSVSYPNAFTPNGDGRNDRFRIVTYGNQLRYELSIYNNWGQRVYYGLDAQEGWDGMFRGKPCEAGTYFYYLNATCFTGKQETHKGDLVLVR